MIATEKGRRAATPKPRGQRTIVCVDDEPLVSRALYRLLSREPYDVLVADSARQALRYVRDFDVDLVITDQRMPDMSGVELLGKVREVSPLTGGLILTAYPESVLVDDPPEAPAPPLFAKPWDDETLRAGVREMLRERDSEPAPDPSVAERPRKFAKLWRQTREAADVAVRTVLVPVDGSIEPELTLRSLLPILRSDPTRIILLQVLPLLGLHRDVYAYLERTRAKLSSEGVDAIADVRWGDPAEQILLHARHAHADLLVLSESEKRGWAQRLHRTLAERLLDETEVPLLIGRPEVTPRSWKRILVPLDGSPEAEAVLSEAVRFAEGTGARIDLVGVSPRYRPVGYGVVPYTPRIPDPMPYLRDIAKLVESEDVLTEARTFEGDPAREILRYAEESGADLICLTAWKRSRWARFLDGGVSREILREARCPVFVRRAST
ncbi:MAG TPA: universal stress protein [Planctomycetota bacterium]|nr:universal stress protein [Planctomycetota bacterium]